MKDLGLLFVRLSFCGTMFVGHGVPKILNFSEYSTNFPDPLGFGPLVSLLLAGFAEIVCTLLIIVGFKTRYVAIPLVINMMVIFFVVFNGVPFGQREMPFLYLLGFIAIAIAGAGKYSIDKQ